VLFGPPRLDWFGSSFRVGDNSKILDDLQGVGLANLFKTNMRLGFVMFAGFARALWKARNKMAIEKTFPNKPMGTIYAGLSFVQKMAPATKAN